MVTADELPDMNGWEDASPEEIVQDLVMEWARATLSIPGMTVDDLAIKEKYKQHLRDEGYE